MFGLTKPKNTILGYEVSGEIESVGKDVKRFKKATRFLELPLGWGLAHMLSTNVCLKGRSGGHETGQYDL